MQRIDVSTAVGVRPAPDATGAPGYFAKSPPGSGVPPTVVSADWANGVQETLAQAILGAGLALDKTDDTQLYQAILSLVGSAAVVGAGALFGLTLSNTPASPTTKITISAGLSRDSTNSAGLTLPAPITKDLTAAWALGDGNGGRDTGALANGQTWHVFLILKPAGGVIDALFSQSPTAPTLPAGFTKFRRLGAVLLDVSATTIQQFVQTGDWFKLKTRSVDYAAQSNGGGVASLRKINVPVGVKVEAEMYFQSTGTADVYLSGLFDPDFGVPPAFGGATQWAQIRRVGFKDITGANNSYGTVMARQFTDTTGKIYTFSSDPSDILALGVTGWRDERGKFY